MKGLTTQEQLDALQARFDIVYGFLVKQFPDHFAGEDNVIAFDPTLNPVDFPLSYENQGMIAAVSAADAEGKVIHTESLLLAAATKEE